MTPRIRRTLLGACLLSLSLLAGTAQADPIRLSTLPALAPAKAPSAAKAPKSIPAGERVAGFYVADPRNRLKVEGNRQYVSLAVFDDAAAADNFEKALSGEYTLFNGDLRNPASNTCFTLTQDAFGTSDSKTPSEWRGEQGTFAQLYGNQPGARAIRAERWLSTPEGAKLETTVLWLDPLTGGLREHSRSTTQLTRLASPYAGLEVYAGRTAPDAVELIVRRDATRGAEAQLRTAPSLALTAQPDAFLMLRNQLVATRAQAVNEALVMNVQLVQESRRSDCGQLRLGLQLRQKPPDLDAPTPADAATPPVRRDSATITTSVVLGVQRELTTYQASMLGLSAEQQAAQVTGLRARALSIHVGISKLSRDAEPIVSLSYRWDGKARDVPLMPSF